MVAIRRHWKILSWLTALLVVTVSGAVVIRLANTASASGIPKTNPLYYAGVITDTSGKPLSGSYTIGAVVWTAATGGTKGCLTMGTTTTVLHGHFRVALDATCVQAIQKNPELWIEVLINGKSMGRAKIGAVPYAIEPNSTAKWDQAHGWGDHATAGYLKKELDPTFKASPAAKVTNTGMSDWSKSHGWGDHAKAGYLKKEQDPVYSASAATKVTTAKLANWDDAHGWGNHAAAGYLKNSAIGATKKDYLCKWDGAKVVSSAVAESGGKIGIGTSVPASTLEVKGTIHSTTGGIKFPDGTVQTSTGQLPPGTVVSFAGSKVPTGWLPCDGKAVSRTTYSALYTALGSSHGAGDGKTTFNVPDYRGRFLRGLDEGTKRDPDAINRKAMGGCGSGIYHLARILA